MFLPHLFPSTFPPRVRLQSKAHQELPGPFLAPQLGRNIARRTQLQGHPLGTRRLLFAHLYRRKIRHRRTEYRNIRLREILRRLLVHLLGRTDVHPMDVPCRSRQSHRSRYQDHIGSLRSQLSRQGKSHLARGIIADKAHRIDLFVRRPGRHQRAPSCQTLLETQQSLQTLHDALRFLHPTLSRQPAGQKAFTRLDDPVSRPMQRIEIATRSRMGIHVQVHRRGYHHRGLAREVTRSEQIVRDAGSHLGKGRGRSRSHQHHIGPHTQFDMAVPHSVGHVGKLAQHRPATQGGQGNRCNEVLGTRSHHYLHFGPRLFQQPHQLRRFVGCNAAGNPQQDVFSFEHNLSVFPEVRGSASHLRRSRTCISPAPPDGRPPSSVHVP